MILKLFLLKRSNWVIPDTILVVVFAICMLIVESCSAQETNIDVLSVQNLNVELFSNYTNVGTATGFVIEKNNKNYLITNLHVVTGKDYFSGAVIDPQLRVPNVIVIWHNGQTLGTWNKYPENLYDKYGNKRWVECEINGKIIDLMALPLENLPNTVKLYPLNFEVFNDSITVMPGFSVSIIGFPYSMSPSGKLAIWKTGHIASDFDVNANGLPIFLIDATTRPGMSGSMVVLRMLPFLQNGSINMALGTRFLGIYSAQSNEEELGYVIKPSALKALIEKLP